MVFNKNVGFAYFDRRGLVKLRGLLNLIFYFYINFKIILPIYTYKKYKEKWEYFNCINLGFVGRSKPIKKFYYFL